MTAHSISTDNANIRHKVQLRQEATKDLKEINVLDLFAGNNILWKNFKTNKYYGVEIEKNKGLNLNANNIRVIASLDLAQFNVIDLDSYGIPFKQLEEIYKNKTLQKNTIIIYTCIGNAMSHLSNVAMQKFGIEKMYKKCQVLFNSMSDDFFHAYLSTLGVKQVREYEEASTSFKKKYGYFIVVK